MFPHDIDNEVKEGDDIEGTELCSWRFAPNEDIEKFESDGMALNIEPRVIMSLFEQCWYGPGDYLGAIPFLQILNICDTSLRIAYHLPKKVCEACLTKFLRSTPVQRPVIYRLSIRRVFKARRAPLPCRHLAAQGRLWGL